MPYSKKLLIIDENGHKNFSKSNTLEVDKYANESAIERRFEQVLKKLITNKEL